MNILITGIHGFVGSNLVIALKDTIPFMVLILLPLKRRG